MPDQIDALRPISDEASPVEKLLFNELRLISKQLHENHSSTTDKIESNRVCVTKKMDELKKHFVVQATACDGKFVKKIHVYVACICAVCFGIGAGVLTFTEVLAIMR